MALMLGTYCHVGDLDGVLNSCCGGHLGSETVDGRFAFVSPSIVLPLKFMKIKNT